LIAGQVQILLKIVRCLKSLLATGNSETHIGMTAGRAETGHRQNIFYEEIEGRFSG
jgi:hypothetical protein